jgi:hypothetical protein
MFSLQTEKYFSNAKPFSEKMWAQDMNIFYSPKFLPPTLMKLSKLPFILSG